MKLPAEITIPRKHRIAVTWVGFAPARQQLRQTEYCGLCDKLALPSAEAARGYIALLMRTTQTFVVRADDWTFVPYPCPHLAGMWHTGHNHKLHELLKAGNRDQGTGNRSIPR